MKMLGEHMQPTLNDSISQDGMPYHSLPRRMAHIFQNYSQPLMSLGIVCLFYSVSFKSMLFEPLFAYETMKCWTVVTTSAKVTEFVVFTPVSSKDGIIYCLNTCATFQQIHFLNFQPSSSDWQTGSIFLVEHLQSY